MTAPKPELFLAKLKTALLILKMFINQCKIICVRHRVHVRHPSLFFRLKKIDGGMYHFLYKRKLKI